MKSISLIALLSFTILTSVTSTFAQSDSTKIEQYCELVAIGKLFSKKVTIDVNFGEERGFFKDTRIRDEITGKVKTFNSVTDALNYMGQEGWSLVNAFPISAGSGPAIYHFYFKKSFFISEVLESKSE